MYILNLPQLSNGETWRDDWSIVAADDLVGMDANVDDVEIRLQVWAKSPRGYGDQSQQLYSWPFDLGTSFNSQPMVDVATNDGTGQLKLADGILSINIPLSVMQQFSPGYYEVGLSMFNAQQVTQLAVGLMPVYAGGAQFQ